MNGFTEQNGTSTEQMYSLSELGQMKSTLSHMYKVVGMWPLSKAAAGANVKLL